MGNGEMQSRACAFLRIAGRRRRGIPAVVGHGLATGPQWRRELLARASGRRGLHSQDRPARSRYSRRGGQSEPQAFPRALLPSPRPPRLPRTVAP